MLRVTGSRICMATTSGNYPRDSYSSITIRRFSGADAQRVFDRIQAVQGLGYMFTIAILDNHL